MDIKREKKTGWKAIFQKKYLPYLFGAVFLIFVAILLLRSNASVLRVSADVVTISNVEKDEFNDYVRLTSTAQPITTVQLSPLETGVVERIVAEEGTKVRRGDVIVEQLVEHADSAIGSRPGRETKHSAQYVDLHGTGTSDLETGQTTTRH